MESFSSKITTNEDLENRILVKKTKSTSGFSYSTGVGYGNIPPKSKFYPIGFLGGVRNSSESLFKSCFNSIKRKRATHRTTVGAVAGDEVSFLENLPEAKWTETFGGMPTTQNYPYSPTFCPRSIFTNLKRIFFSGVNIIGALKTALEQGQTEQVSSFIKSLWNGWSGWLQQVKSRHGTSMKNKKVIDSTYKILYYLFNEVAIEEFLPLFEKLAFAAYEPEKFFNSVYSQVGGASTRLE
jgi:hypothetical protein